ncbi:hypothetical protein E2C01_044495 [Portunus trituberculatus]|uniref:Uncharacterized protein n=1 Tax=Portunus trituberculatus TaxID=210409 RepID=A0A5B7FYL4_PORTR|nr:hypothetical protein [Portunus trituberculatus]
MFSSALSINQGIAQQPWSCSDSSLRIELASQSSVSSCCITTHAFKYMCICGIHSFCTQFYESIAQI